MQINLETADKHAVQSYTATELKINHEFYRENLIISRDKIISSWQATAIQQLTMELMEPMLQCQPEIIIIGHNLTGAQPPMAIMQALSKLRVGIECMSIGAASRTFNILLSEHRDVVLAILF